MARILNFQSWQVEIKFEFNNCAYVRQSSRIAFCDYNAEISELFATGFSATGRMLGCLWRVLLNNFTMNPAV